MTGTIKWFDAKKGFGFITAEDGHDYFVHHNDMTGGKSTRDDMAEGQPVEFEVKPCEKGLRAVEVRATDAAPAKPKSFSERLDKAVTDWEAESGMDRGMHRVSDFMNWLAENG